MYEHDDQATQSTAAIGGHPIHPMLVPFPIAFLVGALASDVAFIATSDAFWARASMWLIGAALVMGTLAAVAGLVDFVTIKAARAAKGWAHALGNVTAVILALVNLMLRLGHAELTVTRGELALSGVVVGILILTGWLGGEMVFRHRIGVIDQAPTPEVHPANAPYDRHKSAAE